MGKELGPRVTLLRSEDAQNLHHSCHVHKSFLNLADVLLKRSIGKQIWCTQEEVMHTCEGAYTKICKWLEMFMKSGKQQKSQPTIWQETAYGIA